MIDFNENDINMAEIASKGQFSGLKTKKSYRIFGLAQDDNPPVGISYNMDKNPSNQVEDELSSFFKANGLELAFEHNEEDRFAIGVRRDIRDNTNLSIALLKTVILHLEGILELDQNFKIPGLNKFVSTETNA